MLKRALWLLSFVLLGWAVWRWWQDRTGDVFEATPHLAASVPPPDYTNPSAPASPAPPAPPPPEPPAQAISPAAAGPETAPATPAPEPDDDLTNPPTEALVALEAPERPVKELAVGAPAQDDGQSAEELAVGAPAQDDGQSAEEAAAPAAPAETAEGSQTPEEAAETEPDESEDGSDGVITGYCVRCKTKRDMIDPQIETTENGRRAARGTCPVCEGTMFTFLKERAPGA
jgi:hypothetical protein